VADPLRKKAAGPIDSMDQESFRLLVLRSIKKLPKIFRKKMENVEIVIEDEPVPQKTLLGLYQGIPLKQRGSWYGNVLPDKITLFQRNIEFQCRNDTEIEDLVNDVLIHEIGHYFGFDEEELRDI
jgi:predicted Zn-dependent protease with MMP-like domain